MAAQKGYFKKLRTLVLVDGLSFDEAKSFLQEIENKKTRLKNDLEQMRLLYVELYNIAAHERLEKLSNRISEIELILGGK